MRAAHDMDRVVRGLRDGVVDHFEGRGEPIADEAGRRTLDTNSTLAPLRADLLAYTFLARSGRSTLHGVRVADLGCGFGALALVLAARGATVVAVDPNDERMEVGRRIARQLGLDVRFQTGTLEEPGIDPESIDLVVANNSLCYLVTRRRRQSALASALRVLVPGGWIVLRNPNRSHPRDPFTGAVGIHRLPPLVVPWLLRPIRKHRSTVRLTTPRKAQRELRRSGFVEVRFDGSGGRRRILDRFARYHHVSGRRPPLR